MLMQQWIMAPTGGDSPADFGRVRELFDGACELPPDQRGAFVRRESGDDAALAATVLRMLAASDRTAVPRRAPEVGTGPSHRSPSDASTRPAAPSALVHAEGTELRDPTRSSLERMRDLFERAHALAAEDRQMFVIKQAGAELGLRDAVLAMLRYAGEPTPRLDEAAASGGPSAGHDLPVEVERATFALLLGAPEEGIEVGLDDVANALPSHGDRVRALVTSLRASDQGRDMVRRLRRIWDAPRHEQRYAVLESLGGGGFGTVSVVRDRLLGRKVAHKTIHPRQGTSLAAINPELVHLFLDEVQIASQLAHPAIPLVHDVGVTALGVPFFTMRYVRGQTLEGIIERHLDDDPAWSRIRIVRILVEVCDALDYAHSKDVLHRDVKPLNVLIGRFGEVSLIDWGMARAHRRHSAAERSSLVVSDREASLELQAMGTPGYTAPEQWTGSSHPGCDVFSVGAILHRLLVGEPARLAPGARDYVVPAVAAARDARLAAVCIRAMASDPGDRYASMRSLRQDLEAYCEQRPLAGVRVSMLGRLAAYWRRWRAWFDGPESAPARDQAQLARARALRRGLAAVSTIAATGSLDGAEGKGEAPTVGTQELPALAAASLRRLRELGGGGARIRVGEEIAVGHMAILYHGEEVPLGRQVAVKIANGLHAEDMRTALLKKLLLEMQVTAQIDHPSVASVHEAGVTAANEVYMVLPLARGGDLYTAARTSRQDRSPWRTTVPLLLQASRGLAWAHAKGVIHGDVKPSNILLGNHRDAYVTDWGLAVPLDAAIDPVTAVHLRGEFVFGGRTLYAYPEQARQFVGTARYVAPERARGEEFDERVDVFGLGATLFELLVGKPPRDADLSEDPADSIAQAGRVPTPPVRSVYRKAPRPLAAVCDRAMQFDPAARYRNAGEFAIALEEALHRCR
jgi:serine/threonine protein kinase